MGFLTPSFYFGGVNLTPPSDLGPEGADRREILHGCEDTSKEYCYEEKNCPKTVYLLHSNSQCMQGKFLFS